MRAWCKYGALAAVGLSFASCVNANLWNDVFERTDLTTVRGWSGGDGAYSVQLPGSGDRTLWLFGDSVISSWNTANGTRTSAMDSYGTHIALSKDSTSGSPDTTFWGRIAGQKREITTGIANETTTEGFFLPSELGLPPSFVWPGRPFRLNDTVYLTFINWQHGCSTPPTGNCVTFDLGGGQIQIEILGRHVAELTNSLNIYPVNWSLASRFSLPASSPWGVSYLHHGGEVFIYGTKPDVANNRNDLVVAKVADTSFTDRSTWRYLKSNDSWTNVGDSEPSLSQLKVIAQDVGSAHVFKTTRYGTRYVLLHTLGEGEAFPERTNHYLYARLGSSPTAFPAAGPTTPRLNLEALDNGVTFAALAKASTTNCEVVHAPGVADNQKCSLTYHGQAHPHISLSDANGVYSLLVSYIPVGIGNSPPEGVFYRPKFAELPLDNLLTDVVSGQPRCASVPDGCWAGILNQHYVRSVPEGQNVEFAIKVQGVSTTQPFKAKVVYGTGNPDLYVRIGAPPQYNGTDHCTAATTSTTDSCPPIQVAPGSTIWIGVRGGAGASSSTFALRTHHVGL